MTKEIVLSSFGKINRLLYLVAGIVSFWQKQFHSLQKCGLKTQFENHFMFSGMVDFK